MHQSSSYHGGEGGMKEGNPQWKSPFRIGMHFDVPLTNERARAVIVFTSITTGVNAFICFFFLSLCDFSETAKAYKRYLVLNE